MRCHPRVAQFAHAFAMALCSLAHLCGCTSPSNRAVTNAEVCAREQLDGSGTFGFFVFGDAHVGPPAGDARVQRALEQMRQIDPNAFAAFSNGDLTDTSSAIEWSKHASLLEEAGFSATPECVESFGVQPRYFASVGDHDVIGPGWYESWKQNLGTPNPTNRDLSQGVYYSVTYANALFVILDSEHLSTAQTSYSHAQTRWLESELANSTALHKFLFFHRPIYPCNSRHEPFAEGLPWVDLAERYHARIIFNSHTHVYTRSCPKYQGACTQNGAGITFVETGPIGGIPRDVDVSSGTVSGTDARGVSRVDAYGCESAADSVVASEPQNDFCHVQVNECQVSVDCYKVQEGSGAPFDSWIVNACA